MLCTDYSVSILTGNIQLDVDYFLPFLVQIFKHVMKPQLYIVIINQTFGSIVSLSKQPHRASDHCIHVYYCCKLLTTGKSTPEQVPALNQALNQCGTAHYWIPLFPTFPKTPQLTASTSSVCLMSEIHRTIRLHGVSSLSTMRFNALLQPLGFKIKFHLTQRSRKGTSSLTTTTMQDGQRGLAFIGKHFTHNLGPGFDPGSNLV